MFEVTVSDEFARWFATLDGRELEEVASTLDVLGLLGPALDPVKASRALLWFDGTLPGAESPLAQGLGAELSAAGDRLRDLMAWQREVMRCLDSPEFAARLAELDAAAAAAALKAVERVHEVLRAARALESLRALMELSSGGPLSRSTVRYLAHGGHQFTWASARVGTSARDAAARPRELLVSLKDAFFEVLSLVGLDSKQIRDPASGLREVTIRTLSPQLRVLYGIDVPQRRLIVLLGEPLTRAYYGDSVRFAERRFREYMQGDALAEASLA